MAGYNFQPIQRRVEASTKEHKSHSDWLNERVCANLQVDKKKNFAVVCSNDLMTNSCETHVMLHFFQCTSAGNVRDTTRF